MQGSPAAASTTVVAGAAGAALAAGTAAVALGWAQCRALAQTLRRWGDGERKEWNSIVDLFERHVGPTLPPGLVEGQAAGSGDEAASSAFKVQLMLEPSYWDSVAAENGHDGDWRAVAMTAVMEICCYIKGAASRKNLWQEPYCLPRHLFLRELLTWLVCSLGAFRGENPERELDVVQKRLGYLKALEEGNVLANGMRFLIWERDVTMRQLFKTVRNLLEFTVEPELRFQQEQLSAGRSLHLLEVELRSHVVHRLLQFLYRIARSRAPDLELVVSAYNSPDDRRYSKELHNRAGEMLRVLTGAPAIAKLYQHQRVAGTTDLAGINPFLVLREGQMEFVLPAGLAAKHKCSDAVTFFSGRSAGVYEALQTPKFATALLELHGLTMEIAGSLSYLQRLQQMCRAGGYLLIYGLMQGRVVALLEALQGLLLRTERCEQTLREEGQTVFDRGVDKQAKFGKWEQNWTRSGHDALVAHLKESRRLGGQISSECANFSLSFELQQLQSEVDSFWKASDTHLERMRALGVYEPPKQIGGRKEHKKASVTGFTVQATDGGAPHFQVLPDGGDALFFPKRRRCSACSAWQRSSKPGSCWQCQRKGTLNKVYVCTRASHEVVGFTKLPSECPHCSGADDLVAKLQRLPLERHQLSVEQQKDGTFRCTEDETEPKIYAKVQDVAARLWEASQVLPYNALEFRNLSCTMSVLDQAMLVQRRGLARLDRLSVIYDPGRVSMLGACGDLICLALCTENVRNLCTLKLEGVGLTSEGAERVGKLLAEDRELQTISLTDNPWMGVRGVDLLCKAILEHRGPGTRLVVSLSSCNLDAEAGALVLELWAKRPHAFFLLDGNFDSDGGGSMTDEQYVSYLQLRSQSKHLERGMTLNEAKVAAEKITRQSIEAKAPVLNWDAKK